MLQWEHDVKVSAWRTYTETHDTISKVVQEGMGAADIFTS